MYPFMVFFKKKIRGIFEFIYFKKYHIFYVNLADFYFLFF